MADNFWLNDAQWALIEAHLPKVHTGPERKDDRRVISGILHRLREGCRWRALPDEYGPYTTVFNRFNRWSKRGLWQKIFAALVEFDDLPALMLIDSSAVKAHRSAAGAKGGKEPGHWPLARRTDDKNPCARRRRRQAACAPFERGHVADIKGAASLLSATAPSGRMIGNKGYDATHLRLFLESRGTTPVIPNKANRKTLFPFDAELYRSRNIIERTFCRIKDFRGIATRYDKLARNFLAAVCLVTALCFWIN